MIKGCPGCEAGSQQRSIEVNGFRNGSVSASSKGERVTESNQTETRTDDGGNAYWSRPRRLPGDRVIGGVAAGLSAWLGIPVVAMRLLFVIAALLNGIGVLAYAALWLALPADGDDTSPPSHLRVIGAAILGSIAALLVLDRFDLPRSGVLLPILLVGTGIALWRQSPVRRPRPRSQSLSPSPSPSPPDEPIHRTSASPVAASDNPPTPVRRVRIARAHVHRDCEPRSLLARIALAAAFAALAIALLADRGDAFDLTLSRGASLLLVVLGAALIIGARYGRARWLVVLAVPLAITLPVASNFDKFDVDPFEHLGNRNYFVDDIAAPLAPTYRNGIGSVNVNLAGIAPDGKSRRTEVRTAIGPIEVFVPAGVRVVVHARAGWGNITIVEYQRDASSGSIMRPTRLGDEHGRDIETTTTMAGEPGAGSLDLELASGLGSIRVVRSPSRSNTTTQLPITTTTTTTTTLANTTIETR